MLTDKERMAELTRSEAWEVLEAYLIQRKVQLLQEQRNLVGQVQGLVPEGGIQEIERLIMLPIQFREDNERRRQEVEAIEVATAEAVTASAVADDGF